MLRVPDPAPGSAGRAASILRNVGARDHRDAGTGTRVSELKNGVTTYFMYGNGGSPLFEVDSSGVKREYDYIARMNTSPRRRRDDRVAYGLCCYPARSPA